MACQTCPPPPLCAHVQQYCTVLPFRRWSGRSGRLSPHSCRRDVSRSSIYLSIYVYTGNDTIVTTVMVIVTMVTHERLFLEDYMMSLIRQAGQ